MNKMRAFRIIAGLLSITALVISLMAYASRPSGTSKSVTPSPVFNIVAQTQSACNDLNIWENGNATDSLPDDPASQVILDVAARTPLEIPFGEWMNDLKIGDTDDAYLQADNVNAVCDSVGVLNVVGGAGSDY
jgi:hypothetical protein